MLRNPFTPSEIASAPDDFFGRRDELKTFERSIRQGFVAIQGPIGIGKSSLLARARLLLEGFESSHTASSVIAVGHKDITSIDAAARLLLESFTSVDEKTSKVRFKLGSVFEVESGDLVRMFVDNRHFSALMRIVEADHLKRILSGREMLVLAIDEADKCPVPLAQLIRAVATHAQQQGVRQLRFVTAGVSPFYQAMVNEDPGISRFFYKTITVQPMNDEEALELIETKLHTVAERAEESGLPVRIDPGVIARIVALAGGHPHILQLLGSHLIEREEEDPDGVVDAKDLANALRKICYEDRARVYDSTIHMLEVNGRLEAIETLLALMPAGFPSRVDKKLAIESIGQEAAYWLMERNIIDSRNEEDYGLVDEFLRVRLLLDEADSPVTQSDIEHYLIEGAILGRPYFDEPPEGGEHEEEEEEE
jgi:AAA+ ATPase superfamily predicted ATPase